MANDPNRDVLPVKEENSCRIGKGSSERIDHQILVKLSRCELEDRFLRLLDEQTNLKKLVNCQEEKIKRLGTKLLRLISEKRRGGKNLLQCKESEELSLKIIELEHENYTLKDKNIVLKQQLATHSRHIAPHRSPLRSTYTSPLMSVRQSAPTQNEVVYDSSSKNMTAESQLQDAEMHIKELNEEIKSLHCKISYLQKDMERNSLDSRKTKVTENIELIRLQRSLKQQSIRIAALQAQVKNHENNQVLLKEELIRAHNENDEAMNLISIKQNEILTLCGQLEKKNLNRFEENELRERINDLAKERDALKERSDSLLKSISVKAEEAERAETYKKLLAEEKLKRERLEATLKETKCLLKNLQDANKAAACCCENPVQALEKIPQSTQTDEEVDKPLVFEVQPSVSFVKLLEEPSIETENVSKDPCAEVNCLCENNADKFPESVGKKSCVPPSEIFQGKYYCADKIKKERESEYLWEMLRNQIALCEAQQTEISRLTYALKVNEDKCNCTLEKLDLYLTAFQNMNLKHPRELKAQSRKDVRPKEKLHAEDAESQIPEESEPVRESALKLGVRPSDSRTTGSSISEVIKSNMFGIHSPEPTEIAEKMSKKPSDVLSAKRFVDQIFLESSEEDDLNDEKLDKVTMMKKHQMDTIENEMMDSENKRTGTQGASSNSINKVAMNPSRKFSLGSLSSRFQSDSDTEVPKMKGEQSEDEKSWKLKRKPVERFHKKEEAIQIGILWLQVDTSRPVWKDDNIKLLFVDFSFFGVEGEETETPESLPKPKSPDEKCRFNFFKSIPITEDKKRSLNSLMHKPDLDLIVFKIVSDPEKPSDDCEEIGVAAVTMKQLLNNCNKGSFVIAVHYMKNYKEVIGNLAVSIDATPGIFNSG